MIFKEKPPKFNSQLFLQSVYHDRKDGIKLKIKEVSDIVKSKYGRNSIFLNLEVMDDFPECLNYEYSQDNKKILDEYNKPVIKRMNPQGFTVGLPFQVNIIQENKINVSEYSNLYNIIYPIAIYKGIAQRNTHYEEITFSTGELKELLKDVIFKGTVKEVRKTNYAPYLRLEVKEIL